MKDFPFAHPYASMSSLMVLVAVVTSEVLHCAVLANAYLINISYAETRRLRRVASSLLVLSRFLF